MSLTVALKISFREDSRKILRSFDLAMLDRAAAGVDNSPVGLYSVKSIWNKKKEKKWVCAALLPCAEQTKQLTSHKSDDTVKLVVFC